MTFERILALDTATETVSVALLDGPRRFYQSDAQYNWHSEQILPFVDTVLKESGLTLKDIDAIAFGAGPGAFTGLRVACGVARASGGHLKNPWLQFLTWKRLPSSAHLQGAFLLLSMHA